MGMPKTEHAPNVIVQTNSVRVIATLKEPFENKPCEPDIVVEELLKNSLHEPYWHPVKHWWHSKSGMTQDERLAYRLLSEWAVKQHAGTVLATIPLPPPAPTVELPVETVEVRPVRPTLTKSEFRAQLASLLTESAKVIVTAMTIDGSMPFDARDGVAVALTPAMLGDLHKMFPGRPYPLKSVELFAKLLERAAEELNAASER